MNKIAQNIKNRLSLRAPQAESIDILAKLADELDLKTSFDLVEELKKVHALYPICSDFERNFPSITFSLATGVGKTRLMGAFITYLYLAKGIKNFFVIAPGNTIYNKLVEDFSTPTHPKYVFKGIAEFVQAPPRIITSDNYSEFRQMTIDSESITVNIFNIQKISSEMRGGKEPKIKRLSECLGDSYFNYLAELEDLVILMDESHHYRADAGMKAINELRPVLGLEVTATPIDSKGNKFKNVVYEYSLAHGLIDGFLKEPAVATRRDFNPDQYKNDPRELDLIKLEDGIKIHEETKIKLDLYSRDTGKNKVKPFVLVVAKDTTHAKEILDMIESDRFFDGRYKGKVMEIHSNQKGSEKEENVQKLVDLESPDNQIEIVIHVNMLKEGWDVTNLYTIIPLRTANSQILTEQTIGRGLRLPYGKKTGVKEVDTLTIIAHDKFNSIVEAANDPNSIIRKENIIEIDPQTLYREQTVVTSQSVFENSLQENSFDSEKLEFGKPIADNGVSRQAKKALFETISTFGQEVTNINQLQSPEVKKLVIQKLIDKMEDADQPDLFKEDLIEAAKQEYEAVVEQVTDLIIPIPRILVQQSTKVKTGFTDFDLCTDYMNYNPVSDEIVRMTLRTNEQEILQSETGGVERDTPENTIVNELINFPEIDYDENSALLYKLAKQAIGKIGEGKTQAELENIILYYKKPIAEDIYAQLRCNFFIEDAPYEEPKVSAFTKIAPHNFTKYTKDKIHHYSETIQPTNLIPSLVFDGFKKACHNLYKFDSKSEKDFATLLEADNEVKKWLRPARDQFKIFYSMNSRLYEPDFVVETNSEIYMFEVKAEKDLEAKEVQEKAEAAKLYCKSATEFNLANNGKPWRYVLLPHNEISLSKSFKGLVDRFEV